MALRVFAACFLLAGACLLPAQQAIPPSQQPAAQQPDDVQSPSPVDPRYPQQLTPEQQREQQIREMNPLDPSDPLNPNRKAGNEAKDKEKSQEERDAEKRRSQDEKPLPGSIAASQQAQGPAVVDENKTDSTSQGYTGPAVLSRSYTINRPMVDQDLKWTESLGVSAVWDSGLTTTMLSPQGTIEGSGTLVGTSMSYGFGGRHLWSQDQLGINLNGNYTQYFPGGGYNGSNTSLTVNYMHRFSRRFSATLVGAGSIFSQSNNLASSIGNPAVSPADINLASSPSIQIFDSTTKQFSLQTNVTWQKTARLSFSAGGSYFAIERDGPGLVGNTGEQATGDVQYRWSYRATIGGYYSYSYYQYPHGLDVTDSHTGGMTYSYAFSQTLQLRLRGGVSRIESLGLQTVPLNPLIAALLGESTGIIDAYNSTVTSDLSGQLVKDFRNGRTANIFYTKGLSPGNGVLQGSEQESMGASGSMKLFRRYTLTLTASRDTLTSISQTIAPYQSESATLVLNRGFAHGVSANFLVSYRYFSLTDAIPTRNEVRVSSGVSWGSGGRLWPF